LGAIGLCDFRPVDPAEKAAGMPAARVAPDGVMLWEDGIARPAAGVHAEDRFRRGSDTSAGRQACRTYDPRYRTSEPQCRSDARSRGYSPTTGPSSGPEVVAAATTASPAVERPAPARVPSQGSKRAGISRIRRSPMLGGSQSDQALDQAPEAEPVRRYPDGAEQRPPQQRESIYGPP